MPWSVADYSVTPSANVSINGINIDEFCAADGYNNALRQIMADIKAWAGTYTPVAYPTTIGQGGTGQITAPLALAALGGLSADYRQIPQSTRTSAFTFNLPQGGGHTFYTGTTATCSVPHSANVDFPIGATIVLVNGGSGVLSILRGLDVPTTGTPITMRWATNNSDADRNLAVGGMATMLKTAQDLWYISGAGLS